MGKLTQRGAENRRRVAEYRARGMTAREISLLMGITTQSVHRHLKALEADGELPQEKAS